MKNLYLGIQFFTQNCTKTTNVNKYKTTYIHKNTTQKEGR